MPGRSVSVRKILHVTPSVGPLRGPTSAAVRLLARNLARAGLDTHIATTDDNADQRLAVPHGLPVTEDGVTYWFFPRQLRRYSFSRPLASWLKRRVAGFDVVHIHGLFCHPAVAAARAARRRGVPYIVRPMGTLASAAPAAMPGPPRPWSYRLIESRLLRRAALIQYSTEVEERDAERLVIATPSVVIPDVACDAVAGRRAAAGSRAEEAADALASGAIGQWPITIARGVFRRQSGIPRDRPIVLFLAPLQPAMGIDLLLRAFATLRGRLTRALLVVAGDGVPEYVDWTKTEAQSLGLSDDAVIWQPAGTDAEKAALLADADVFALPSCRPRPRLDPRLSADNRSIRQTGRALRRTRRHADHCARAGRAGVVAQVVSALTRPRGSRRDGERPVLQRRVDLVGRSARSGATGQPAPGELASASTYRRFSSAFNRAS
jgi:glycosyltransferase involved in cell wall biosynthesis